MSKEWIVDRSGDASLLSQQFQGQDERQCSFYPKHPIHGAVSLFKQCKQISVFSRDLGTY